MRTALKGRPCVLVLDEDRGIRDSLALMLAEHGYAVREAPEGRTALEALRRDGPVDRIGLDLMMPGMDGWELREALLRDPELCRIPVGMLSGAGDVPAREATVAATTCSEKPLPFNRLLSARGRLCPRGMAAPLAVVS